MVGDAACTRASASGESVSTLAAAGVVAVTELDGSDRLLFASTARTSYVLVLAAVTVVSEYEVVVPPTLAIWLPPR